MTTANQNQWAQMLEGATAREIRQMAEYAIDHINSVSALRTLSDYLNESIVLMGDKRD